MAASSSAVGTAFAIQIGVALIVFFAFSYLRLTTFARRFYAPKRFDKSLEYKPKRLPPGFFAWMKLMYTYPEQDLIKVSGLDSAMYIRVLQFGWEVFVRISIWCCLVILPINITGDRVQSLLDTQAMPAFPPPPDAPDDCARAFDSSVSSKTQNYQFTPFDKLSMANITSGSRRYWAHVISVYLITYWVLELLWKYNKEATLMRLAFLANQPRGGPSHTVLVTDIPGMKHGTIIWYLRMLAGSTLFVWLPQRLRKKVLDIVEDGFGAMHDGMNIAGHLVRGKQRFSEEGEGELGPDGSSGAAGGVVDAAKAQGMPTSPSKKKPKPPPSSDPFAVAAKINTKAAKEVEDAKRKKKSGALSKLKAKSMIKADDEALDPWKQAEKELGDAAEPRAHAVQGFLYNEMEFCYGHGSVAAVNPVWDQAELEGLLKEYNKLKQSLEDYLDKCAFDLKRRKPIKKRLQVSVMGPTMGTWGINKYGMKPVKVDAIEFWSERLRVLSDLIIDAQQRARKKPVPSSFVTFHHRRTQVATVTNLHHHDETTWQVGPAPEPKEIIWSNLGMRAWERSLRTMLMWGGYFALLMFFMIPVAAVQALIEVPRLASIPVLGTIVNLPLIRQLLEAIVPGLVLLIFLALLPMLLAFMCRLSGFKSISEIDFGVVSRYFYFQLLTVFIGSIIAGSLFNQLKVLVDQPGQIINLLGVGIPMTSTFFINYILVAGIGKVGIKHLRIPQLVIFWLLSKVASTPRARARLWADQYTLYGPTVPYYTVAFLLGLVYCCINPIIAPTVLVYFSFGIISERYNNLYVFKREYESGGHLWLHVFNQFIVALYFMQVGSLIPGKRALAPMRTQIIMMIILAINKFAAVPVLVPCLVFTFVFHVACLLLFRRPWTVMSSHDAAMLDLKDQADRGAETATPDELREITNMYLSPVFKVDLEDLDELQREALITSRRINGEKLEDIEAELDAAGYVSAEEEVESEDDGEESTSGGSSVENPTPKVYINMAGSTVPSTPAPQGGTVTPVTPSPGTTPLIPATGAAMTSAKAGKK